MIRILCTILTSFFKIGLFTIGGGLAIIPLVQQEMLSRGWLTSEEFIDILGIAQMTPGPIGVNTATFVGYRVPFIQGYPVYAAVIVSLIASAAVVLPSVIGVHFGGRWFERNRKKPWMERIFLILRPLVTGFILAAGSSLAIEVFGASSIYQITKISPTIISVSVFALAICLTLTKKISPLWSLLVGALTGIMFL